MLSNFDSIQRMLKDNERVITYKGLVRCYIPVYMLFKIMGCFLHSLTSRGSAGSHITMFTVKSNYDNNGKLTFTSSPYTPVVVSDGDDDDLCVWDYTFDSEEETFTNDKGKNKVTSQLDNPHSSGISKVELSSKHKSSQNYPRKLGESNNSKMVNSTNHTEVMIQSDRESLENRQMKIDSLSAIHNLTIMSQYMLKLEARVGKTSKEAIRQTLDDTAEHATIDLLEDGLSQQELTQRIVSLSERNSRRMYLIDRNWRQQSTRKQEDQTSQTLTLLDEASVKSWISFETKESHIMRQDPCYFTVRDLASGRKPRDWIMYLSELCGFKGSVDDDRKLLSLAWRFLDRDLRGEIPSSSTNVEGFVSELEYKFNTGQFETALADPEEQEKKERELWTRIRRLWSARTRPQ